MQSLRDYLNHTQQYESILNPDQNQVMSRMTDDVDDMIRKRIREYCTWDRQKYYQGELWPAVDDDLEITQIDKDNNGWYIETTSSTKVLIMHRTESKSFYDYCLSKGQKMDKQKGFLIEDLGVYFRWRKHKGSIEITDASCLESTLGLPEELDELYLNWVCFNSRRLDVCNKIKVILLGDYIPDLEISGNGCKDVIIHPVCKIGNITAPSQTKILRPKTRKEYWDLRKKIVRY